MNQLPRRTNAARRLFAGLLDLVYPPVCLHCSTPLDAAPSDACCDACLQLLQELLGEKCPRCAAPAPPYTLSNDECRYCEDESYAFTRAIAWGAYQSVLRDLVLKMKHGTGEPIGYHLAAMLLSQYRPELLKWPIDAIVPVPLHWTRRLWRGYNQAAVVAQVLAEGLGKPYRPRCLWRRLATPPQMTLSAEDRRRNLRDAFAARLPHPLQGACILLVDDVMTTGSTADFCARSLLAAGAREVSVVVLARALGESATDSPPRKP
jgi:ComF family protein